MRPRPNPITPEKQIGQALCLSVGVNAIIVWNTVYTHLVLEQLRADGQLITTSEIEQISPLPHQHINAYGHQTRVRPREPDPRTTAHSARRRRPSHRPPKR